MKILCDKALPNAVEVFEEYGQVVLHDGRTISAADLKDIDALIIRSVTKVNEDLIKDASKLKFVGTATAGTDHIDLKCLSDRDIFCSNAEGSNAVSVADYILSVLLVLSERYDFTFVGKSIGIIGCGHVGSNVELKARALGLNIYKCDPPRLRMGDTLCSSTFEECLSCDIVTLHVPMIKEGQDRTYHMLGRKELMSLKKDAVLINASRGGVVDNNALNEVLVIRPDLKVWLDVFEGEPSIDVRALLPKLEGATAHIAGYSYESKRRATVMLAHTMAKMLNLKVPGEYTMPKSEIEKITLGKVELSDLDLIRRLVFSVYDVRRDSHKFKYCFKDAKSFDDMRRSYRERREISSVVIENAGSCADLLRNLGFTIK